MVLFSNLTKFQVLRNFLNCNTQIIIEKKCYRYKSIKITLDNNNFENQKHYENLRDYPTTLSKAKAIKETL